MEHNVLVISYLHEFESRVFEGYNNGIKTNSKDCYFVDYIDQYLQLGKKRLEEKIKNLVAEKKINYIFFISVDLTFEISFIEKLTKYSKIIMIFFDTEHFFESVDRYYAQTADLVLLTDYLSKYRFKLLNINVLCTFSLFNSKYYQYLGYRNKNIDVSFVGSMNKIGRKEYIDYLKNNGISVKCYGRDTENGFISFEKMVEIFNESKININLTGKFDSKNTILGLKIDNRIKQSKGRPIEIALCGGFVLTEYAPGIKNMFEIGKEMDVFHTKEDLLEKVKYYLENENEREYIAKRGYEKALRDYDANVAFKKIFDVIDNYARKDSNIYLDDNFVRNYTTYRFFYISHFFLHRKFKNLFEEFFIILKYRKISYKNSWRYILKSIALYLNKYPKLKNKLRNKIKNGSSFWKIFEPKL